jgi:DNA replication protein DnaC
MPRSTRHPTCYVLGRPAPVRATLRQQSVELLSRDRVLFTRTTDIVQKLQAARQALQLEAAIYDLLILDDLSYVHKDHAETSVLFELIGARYERRSMLITANHPFADWDKVFPDHAMMIAAIDRLVYHAILFEMNVESYRRRGALDRKSQTAAAASKKAKGSASC